MPDAPTAALFVGLLAGSEALLVRARAALAAEAGPIALASEPRPWSESDYYEAEMGKGLLRQWLVFERAVPMGRLGSLKRRAIALEDSFRPGAAVSRPVNIDPGLLDAHSLRLASTKPAGHRVWVGDGIWVEITLTFKAGGWALLPWTYPDFRRPETHEFLTAARKLFSSQK